MKRRKSLRLSAIPRSLPPEQLVTTPKERLHGEEYLLHLSMMNQHLSRQSPRSSCLNDLRSAA
jgi:hypothetical protein